jgi:hypothetical protein
MSIDDTDVLARLRAGADAVEEYGFDADDVLAGSRSALRRRRSWQAVGACTTAAAVAFSLFLAGPVPIPGVGEVTLPGSEQMRELFGIADSEASDCAVPEPLMWRTPEPEAPASARPEPGACGHGVPVPEAPAVTVREAPRVSVPEDAVFATYD